MQIVSEATKAQPVNFISGDPLKNLRESAAYTGLSMQTIRRAIRTGKITARQFGARGDYLIRLSALEHFISEMPLAVPKAA